MKAITFIAFFCVILFTSSCQQDLPEAKIIKLDETETITIGERYEFKKGDFFIEFNEVTEDNRCPAFALCIWEGYADIAITIHQYRAESPRNLQTINRADLALSKTIEYDDYIIELIDLAPYPGEADYGDDFKADFRITKK